MKDLKKFEIDNIEHYQSPTRAITNIINKTNIRGVGHNIERNNFVIREDSMKTRKRLSNNIRNYTQQSSIIFHLSNFGSVRNRMHITKQVSMPEIKNGIGNKKKTKLTKSSNALPWTKNNPYNTKYILSEYRFKCSSTNCNVTKQTNFKIYRCQVAPGVAHDCHKCCCSCNSDVLFEVMKDLYDCYKNRDCNNCNCILCCNLPEHERSEMLKKSAQSMGLAPALKELAMKGFPLPEGKTDSEKNLIDKIRYDLGLPPEPKTDTMRNKYTNAANAGLLVPLEKKTPPEKERILKGLANMGIPLPEGRTPSEKSLIAKIQAGTGTPLTILSPSEQMRKAKSAGLLTPFEGKTSDRIEKISRGLAMQGIPLPKGKTPSKNKLINKVRTDLGLPPEPKTPAMEEKHKRAAKVGLLVPLEGKSPAKKEKILQGLHNMDIPLPVGRTPSEKALIAKVKAESKTPPITSSEKLRAKASSLRYLKGKTPAQKEAILKAIAMKGVSLPAGMTDSEKDLINKVRRDLGLPPEPKTPSMKDKHAKAAEAGFLLPLEGKPLKEKERILKGLADMNIPLPKPRTPSEKALISKVKLEAREPLISPEKMRKAKAAGLLTPLEGKTQEQKEKIFRGLAMHGIPLPEGKTKSEKNLLNKIRIDLGLPPEPKTPSMKEKHTRAADAGLLLPLEGKSPKEKEKILRSYVEKGIPLPEGRTPSEKALIASIKSKPLGAIVTSDKLQKAKAAGLLTPLQGKPTKEKERILKELAKTGLPLPAGKSPSEVALIKQIKKDFGIPEESSVEKIRKAKATGLLTPLEDKTPEQQEIILRGRAAAGLPLPPGTSPSQRELIKKIKATTGYITPSPSERLRKAQAAGLLTPIKGKTPSTKEKILKDMLAAGVPIAEGTTPSEKEMIKKVIGPVSTKSKRMKAAKSAGLLTPLSGKTPEQKEKILTGLAKMGLPLPKPKTPSERELIHKIRADMGLPPEPKSQFLRDKYERAHDAGIITPLEGKTPAEKEKILKRFQSAGIPLPSGRTRSEKSLIKRIKAGILASPKTPFDEMTPEEKVKRLKHLTKLGRPLPEAKTPSGKALVEKVRNDMGLPPAPKSESMKLKMQKAYDAGLIIPLEGKNDLQKKKILSRLAKTGIPLPKGRTPSEKTMIRNIKSKYKKQRGSSSGIPSEILAKAKELGLLTPLAGKPPEEKERILRELAAQGLPLPETTSPSEKLLADKIRKELGLPPEPTTPSMKEKHNLAAAAGTLVPLEGLSDAAKKKVLQDLADIGIPLPEGRTPSEKHIIKMMNEVCVCTDSEMIDAEMSGLLTPLTGKSYPEKEKILRGLAEAGLPLPKGSTKSEKSLIRKIKAEFGIPPRGTTPSQKDAIRKAKAKGLFTPLTGKNAAEKERIIRGLAEAGLPLPAGKTATEKDIIKRVKAELDLMSTVSESMKPSKSTCERACGCDTKKIKFKHSYVKISIVSPDISNLCPCPNECIPGIKGGLFAANKGINVVVERAVGTPQYSRQHSNAALKFKEMKPDRSFRNTSGTPIKTIFEKNCNDSSFEKIYERFNLESDSSSDSLSCPSGLPFIHSCTSCESRTTISESDNLTDSYSYYQIPVKYMSNHTQISDVYDTSDYFITSDSCQGSYDSIHFIKSETSLSSTSSCDVISADSIISIVNGARSSKLTLLLDPPPQFDISTESSEDGYSTDSTIVSGSPSIIKTQSNQLIYRTKKQEDVFQVFQMSHKNRISVPETASQSELTNKTGHPVLVINQLDSDIDVSAVVDEILTKEEFCNASSLFVIVPTSDDEDEPIKSDDSIDTPTCFRVSKNYNKWNCTDEEELRLPNHRTSKIISGLRVSSKGRKFFLQGVPAATIAPHNKETTLYHDSYKTHGVTGNKICQETSLSSIDQSSHIVSTDTTQDRPCCCGLRQSDSFSAVESKNDRCIMNVVSEIIVPMLSNQAIESKALSVAREASNQDTKSMPLTAPVTSVSFCRLPPCSKVPRTCHFSDSVQYSNDCNPPEPIEEIKKLLEQQSPSTIKELCDQLRTKPISGAGPTQPHKPVNIPPIIKTPIQKMPLRPPVQMLPGHVAPVPGNYLPMNEICPTCKMPKVKNGVPVPCNCPVIEICPTCFKPKYKDGKIVNCACSGKKKTIKFRPLCPCEQHQWPMSKILFGPKPGTRSVGCQCCMCDDVPAVGPNGQIIPRLGKTVPQLFGPPVSSGIQYGPGSIITPKGYKPKMQPTVPQPIPIGFYGQPNLEGEMGQLEIYGPLGGFVIEAPGGTYTQAGLRQTRYSTGVATDFGNVGVESATRKKKNCVCADKKGKKRKKKVICQCPPAPEIVPEPHKERELAPILDTEGKSKGIGQFPDLEDIEPEPQSLQYLEYYDEYLRNKIESHRRQMKQMHSDLTQTTSGFKFNKRKKPPSEVEPGSDESDVSIEDVLRYYALTNPDLMRELLPPDPKSKEDCTCEDVKSVNTDVICECPEESLTEEQKAAKVTSAAAAAGGLPGGAIIVSGPEFVAASQPDASKMLEGDLPKGFKLKMPGKGSGSKGLTGICCFDMIEER